MVYKLFFTWTFHNSEFQIKSQLYYKFFDFLFISSFKEIFSHFTLSPKNSNAEKNEIILINKIGQSRTKTEIKAKINEKDEIPF